MARLRIEIWFLSPAPAQEERIFEIVLPVEDKVGLLRTLDFIKAGVEEGRQETRLGENALRPDTSISDGKAG